MSGLVCSGNVRVAYVDADGVLTGGYIGILNAVKLALSKPAPDLKQRTSHQNENFGEALDQLESPKPTEVSLTVDDTGDAETLGWALGGTPAGFTQSVAAAVAQTIENVTLGEWASIGKRGITTLVVKDSTDTSTYVANTDYILDARAGFIKPLAGGSIVDGSDLHLTVTAPAMTGNTISVGTRQSIQVRIDGDMINLATGKSVHVVVPRAKLSPTGELDFMGADFLQTALSGTALSVSGQPPASVTLID